jgi:hypothetical protein
MSEVTKETYQLMTVGDLRHQLSKVPDSAEVVVSVTSPHGPHQIKHVVVERFGAWVNIVITQCQFLSPAPSDGAEAAE